MLDALPDLEPDYRVQGGNPTESPKRSQPEQPNPPPVRVGLLLLRAAVGVHVQRPDGPISFLQHLRVSPDKLLAIDTLLCNLGATGCKRRPTQITTEGDVEYEPHVLEVFWVARPAVQAEVRVRRTPNIGIGLPQHQVCRLCPVRPEPGSNVASLRVPLRSKGATPVSVEGLAHGRFRTLLGTTLVLPLAGSRYVAVVCREPMLPSVPVDGRSPAGAPHARLVAAGARVQRGRNARGLVDALYDVKLPP
mmetsp:Transcript_138374/g.385982  ORF Transcript_138374/g.385982 Transcript_138374/m.385982 type:complete len:249 (+) Transcript_138374:470-1216(+)